jgi:phage gp36-like protein
MQLAVEVIFTKIAEPFNTIPLILKLLNCCAIAKCLVENRALNDPDEQLRGWAQEQLKMQNVKLETED